MTKTTSQPRSGRFTVLILSVLQLVGCGVDRLTTQDPATEAQAEAIKWSYRAAEVKGIKLDAVVFDDPVNCGKDCVAGAWAVCGQHAVGWNKNWLEEPGAMRYIKGFAAHEVCHVYYKDNLPCTLLSMVDREAMEQRAGECGEELMGRM